MTPTSAQFDSLVRVEIFRSLVEERSVPTCVEVAAALGISAADAAEAFRRLAEGRVIVLQPGTNDIWMANPFSATPTGYVVRAGTSEWFGNCIWDSFGILGLLGGDGAIRSNCPDCAEPQTIVVREGRVAAGEGLVHFAVPAAHWWDDIGYT